VRRTAITLLVLLLSAAAPMCGRPLGPYERAIHKAWELERKGEFLDAAALAQKAADIAAGGKKKLKGEREKIAALFLKAHLLMEAGKYDEAREVLLWLGANAREATDKGRAIYDLGLVETALGDRQAAKKQFLKLIAEYPDHGLCSVALKKTMFTVKESEGEGAVKALLLKLLPDALKSSFGDDVLWELAKLEKKNGRLDEAEKYLLMIDKGYPYPIGGAVFEYLFLLAEIEEERGNFQKAIGWLQKIVDTAEPSYILGDYNDDPKARALILIGRIYLEKKKDPEKAYETFMKVVKLGWKTRSDDGLWWAAEARFAQGRSEEACGLLGKLVDKFEYSNFRRESLKVLQSDLCSVSP
jgi:tetratricopeptide (TPR) repeat protein